jgi:hypothetical protein
MCSLFCTFEKLIVIKRHSLVLTIENGSLIEIILNGYTYAHWRTIILKRKFIAIYLEAARALSNVPNVIVSK